MLKKVISGLLLCVAALLMLTACGGPSSATFELSNTSEYDITLEKVMINGQDHLEQNLTLKPFKSEGSSFTTTFSGTGKVPVTLVLHDPGMGATVTYETELEMPKKASYQFSLLYLWGQFTMITMTE